MGLAGAEASARRICGGSIAVKPSLTKMTDLRSLTQRPQANRQPLQGTHDDVVPDALDLIGRIASVVLLELIERRVVELAALEVVDRAHHDVVIAGERQILTPASADT